MTAARQCTASALGALLRDQPLSRGKVALAWSVAVGRTVERVTSVELDGDGALTVTAADRHWARELHRSRPLLTTRLNQVLGHGAVTRIEISSRTAQERQSHARVGHR